MNFVYCIGEALIDFTPTENNQFKMNAGGAPANVAATVSKLGGGSKIITQVGNDHFGQFLFKAMEKQNIHMDFVKMSDAYPTSLAFVSYDENHDRHFSFYRNETADLMLDEEDCDFSDFKENDILHFCSVNLVDSLSKQTHIKAIKAMEKTKGIISFDPNIRLPLWKDPEKLKETILVFKKHAHILKVSDDELAFITGIEDEDAALKSLFVDAVKIILYTKGKEGMRLITKDFDIKIKGNKVNAIDTTGAGDAAIGSLLYLIQKHGLHQTHAQFESMIKMANDIASQTVTQVGALDTQIKNNFDY